MGALVVNAIVSFGGRPRDVAAFDPIGGGDWNFDLSSSSRLESSEQEEDLGLPVAVRILRWRGHDGITVTIGLHPTFDQSIIWIPTQLFPSTKIEFRLVWADRQFDGEAAHEINCRSLHPPPQTLWVFAVFP